MVSPEKDIRRRTQQAETLDDTLSNVTPERRALLRQKLKQHRTNEFLALPDDTPETPLLQSKEVVVFEAATNTPQTELKHPSHFWELGLPVKLGATNALLKLVFEHEGSLEISDLHLPDTLFTDFEDHVMKSKGAEYLLVHIPGVGTTNRVIRIEFMPNLGSFASYALSDEDAKFITDENTVTWEKLAKRYGKNE